MLLSSAKAIFLFSSTIIRAGILAVPIEVEEAGFLPLATMIVLVALVSTLSGFYISESALADQEHPYLPTLAWRYLGTWGLTAMLFGIAIYIYGALLGYLAARARSFSRGRMELYQSGSGH